MKQTPISTGADVVLANYLVPEQPTIIVFYKPSSMLEQQFFEGLQAQLKDKPVGLKAGYFSMILRLQICLISSLCSWGSRFP